jgi:DNA-binding NtrC family response regulator
MPESRHVLIVDNDEDVRELFSDIVTLLGFTPKAVGSGVSALQQLKTSSFDLVILDARTSDMDGLEIFKALRQFNSSVPVVLTSSHGMDKTVQEALSMGALLCLEKPFDVSRAMKTLQDIVEKESPRR